MLLPSDNTVAAYWITNPDNIYRDNVAAGSDENGFWMSLPEHPNGAFAGLGSSKATWPRNMSIREFKGNVAHSNYDGVHDGPEHCGQQHLRCDRQHAYRA